jgi:hypothetical protein
MLVLHLLTFECLLHERIKIKMRPQDFQYLERSSRPPYLPPWVTTEITIKKGV